MNEILKVTHCGYYISNQVYKSQNSPLRTLSDYEIELYTTSVGESIINGISYPHSKGTVIVGKPGQKRYTKNTFECYYVHFSISDKFFCDKYLNCLPDSSITYDFIQFTEIYNEIIHNHSIRPHGYELLIKAKLYDLIGKIYCAVKTYGTEHGLYEDYKYIIYQSTLFIKQNYSENISLNDIATIVHLSPNYLHKIFKTIIGISPNKYLLKIRLSNAKKLLINTKKSISEISEKCGFSSQSYMNYIFNKELGISPAKYRKNNRIIF